MIEEDMMLMITVCTHVSMQSRHSEGGRGRGVIAGIDMLLRRVTMCVHSRRSEGI